MATAQLGAVRNLFDRIQHDAIADGGDGDLLDRFLRGRDHEAFELLVHRHGPMVLGVCRRVLRNRHAADDAFQATFLVLAKKAGAVRPPGVLGAWLHGVAYRTALKARGREFRRQHVEREYAANRPPPAGSSEFHAELWPILDRQLSELPEKYRLPLILCGVQGLRKAEAAECLGLPEGTVSSRLARARDMLRDRLARRGIVVPVVAIAAALTPRSLQAAVNSDLSASTVDVAVGLSPIAPQVLSLSHEVLTAMTLAKWKLLSALAVAVALTAGGFGYTASADEKKPQPVPGESVKKPAVEGEKPAKPAPAPETRKPKPAGDKPGAIKLGGTVGAVDAKAGTITITTKSEKAVVEKVVKLTTDAKLFIDGKVGELAKVPKGSYASFLGTAVKEGQPIEASEVWINGLALNGVIGKADDSSLTLDVGGKEVPTLKTLKLTADTKINLGTKEPGKASDLKAGDRVSVVPTSDGSTALTVTGGRRRETDAGKPGGKLGGKVAGVDAAARTITLATKGDGTGMVVHLTADAKVTIDGKDAKLADVAKGMTVAFTIASAKDGQPREASAVIAAGPIFVGIIKQLDAASLTVGTEKADRVMNLAPGAKVMIGEKEAKLADLKVGDKVSVTLTADESAAMLIVSGVNKPTGDKPVKPGVKPGVKPTEKPKPEGEKKPPVEK